MDNIEPTVEMGSPLLTSDGDSLFGEDISTDNDVACLSGDDDDNDSLFGDSDSLESPGVNSPLTSESAELPEPESEPESESLHTGLALPSKPKAPQVKSALALPSRRQQAEASEPDAPLDLPMQPKVPLALLELDVAFSRTVEEPQMTEGPRRAKRAARALRPQPTRIEKHPLRPADSDVSGSNRTVAVQMGRWLRTNASFERKAAEVSNPNMVVDHTEVMNLTSSSEDKTTSSGGEDYMKITGPCELHTIDLTADEEEDVQMEDVQSE